MLWCGVEKTIEMVLAELGSKISAALHKLQASNVVDESVVGELVKEIGRALILGDVDVHLVRPLFPIVLPSATAPNEI